MKKGTAMRATGLAFLLSATTLAVGSQQPTTPVLQAEAEQAITGASGTWGVMAWSVNSGTPLISINANAPLIPASNNKVMTAIWALDELGPEHRFSTDLLITGPIEGGAVRGDVVLRGSGDPAFGYPPRLGFPEFAEEPMEPLRKMAQRLASEGVRVVEGSVIGDGTVFDSTLVGPSWPNDTGAGAAQYAPRVSGLAFQRNMIWVLAGGNAPGEPLVRLDPLVDVVPLKSSVTAGGGRALAVRRPNEDTIRISGSVPARNTSRYGVGVADPALLAAGALKEALREVGIEVRGGARTGATPEGATLVHRHVSMPLGSMIGFLNQHSDNFYAEHLWKAAAASAIGEGSYLLGGPASALHFIHNAAVPAGEIYQFDGSGLSNYTRLTANALVKGLVYAHQQPYSELFHKSMAVAADPRGTMNRLYRNTAAAGNLHAKTGYINRVRTLSGYVQARNGELIAFSFLYNGGNTNGARNVQERLGVLLAEYGG